MNLKPKLIPHFPAFTIPDKRILFTIFCLQLFLFDLNSQSTKGITGKTDTSFTNQSAFNSSKKQYPDIRMVEEFHLPSVKETRNIVYCTLDKRKLILDAFYPSLKDKKARTAIIIVHGGGWRSGNRAQHYPLAQKLAELGYVCFTPEYRLSTEALYPAAIYDIKSAIRWVHQHVKEYNIDPSGITILGFSAGGELAAFMGATNDMKKFDGNGECSPGYSSRVDAIVDIDGILAFIHPESAEGDDTKSTSAATYWFGYSKAENPGLWNDASALTHAGKHTPPTLFINSSAARMHAGRRDYINILGKFGIYTEVNEFKDSPHSFCLFEPWFQPTVKYIDAFLKKIFNK